MKRRAAVEPLIGHLKNEHRLERIRLKGVAGDAMNAILSAAAMNFQKLLRACERKLAAEIRTILNRLHAPINLHQLPDRLAKRMKSAFSGSTK
jgi:IS5 family transposase